MSKRRRTAGSATVEMVFVLPLLLVLIFAIGEFGLAFARWQTMVNAVREGARVGIVFRTPCNAGAVDTLVQTTVDTYANSMGIAPPLLTVTGSCTGTNTQLTVNAQSPYAFPLLSAFIPGFLPSINLGSTAVMRNE
jgi:Flp pilus assembly protein TadG